MGILSVFGGKSEEKMNMEAEKRGMQFQRELEASRNILPEDRIEVMNQEGKSDLLKWQQDLDDFLYDLIKALTGWRRNIDGSYEEIEGQEPLCNEKFIQDVVIPQCKPWLSRNLINSTMDEDRILMFLKMTMNTITANMADGYDVYDIEFQNYDIVLSLIANTIVPAGYRALDGFTKKTDSTIFKKLESSYDSAGQPRRTMGFK